MSAEVTHIVAELEDSIHKKVGTPDITRAPIIHISLLCSHQSRYKQNWMLYVLTNCCDLCEQELQHLVHQYSQAVAVQKDWLESCFSKQQRVDTAHFLHLLP